jgi:isoleucyl-tRNA synthetase
VARLGRAARAAAGLRVRQPLARALVFAPEAPPFPHFEADVLEELNVKELQFVSAKEQLGPVHIEEGDIAVGLDTQLTDELIAEGIARDLVRHIQNLRKQAGLRVDQRIGLWIESDAPEVAAAVRQYGPYIAAETLASDLRTDPPPPDAVTADCRVAGRRVTLALLAHNVERRLGG